MSHLFIAVGEELAPIELFEWAQSREFMTPGSLLLQGGAEVTWKIIFNVTLQEKQARISEEYLPGRQKVGDYGVTPSRAWGRPSGNTA